MTVPPQYDPEAIDVDEALVAKVERAIEAALEYEKATDGRRKLGITGEVGEVVVCKCMGLRMAADPRSMGYDAMMPAMNLAQTHSDLKRLLHGP